MSNIKRFNFAHPLVGTWVTEEEDSLAEFTIAAAPSGFVVTGRSIDDNEAFVISNVAWDGTTLRFDSFMPSTQHGAKHAVRIAPDGRTMEHELTLLEIWKKKPSQR